MCVLIGCQENTKSTDIQDQTYYRVDSLLNAQIDYLTRQKGQLHKTITTDEQTEEVLVKMDSLQWATAVAIFRVLDINNPALKDTYAVTGSLKDSISNLTILHYQLKEDDTRRHLKELNFYYLDSIENLKKITAKTSFQSYIFNAQNQFVLTFDQMQSLNVLKSYHISTTHKTLFKNPVHTAVDFEIRYQ
jgi:hypothetical protein